MSQVQKNFTKKYMFELAYLGLSYVDVYVAKNFNGFNSKTINATFPKTDILLYVQLLTAIHSFVKQNRKLNLHVLTKRS